MIVALMSLAFKAVLYKTADLWDVLWKGRPEWARPAVGGIAVGLLLLAVPQMYGVGYPVMYKARPPPASTRCGSSSCWRSPRSPRAA